MNLQLYKPNSKNTGCAISFQIGQKPNQEPQFYVNCIAQHSWDDSKRSGSFSGSRNDPSKTVAVKFNEFELGEIINTFQTKTAYSTYHSNESVKTQIRLSTYEKTRGSGDFSVKVTAFGLTIIRNGSDTFKVPIEPGEAVRITAYINKYFEILDEYRASQQKDQKYAGKTNSKPQQKAASEPTPSLEEEVGF